MSAGSDRVLFGAAYYHEYQPYDRLDVDLMQEAHFAPTGAAAVDGTRLRSLHETWPDLDAHGISRRRAAT